MTLRLVEPDYHEILTLAHRRWINERTVAAAEAFDRALMAAIHADRVRRSNPELSKDTP